MTLALRGFIVGLVCASCVAYFYQPSFLVVCVAFWLGHVLALVLWWVVTALETRRA